MAAYARQAAARSGAAFTVSGNTVTLAALISFPAMAGGAGGTVTHCGFGLGSSGATQLVFFGTVTPNLAVVAGITPKLDTGTTITQNASDAMADAAATAFLTLLFVNTDWANVGDAGGLQNSAAPGSFYLSLHTTSPGTGGTQATNEISYT